MLIFYLKNVVIYTGNNINRGEIPVKKVLSVFLSLVLVFGICLSTGTVAFAQKIETENGVQVEISPYLYKSKLYTMEYPSHASYSIKEKSNEGDYAISREINDLAYTFIFPAGTTEISCKVSLDSENWRGYTINTQENPDYWAKNDDGSVDLTKPLTFNRIAELAEQDEYGVLYRDFLKDADAEGFRDYDKIYWRLTFTKNSEEYTEYFEIKLYDYDNAEKFTVRAANYNVAGLPFTALTGEDVAGNQAVSAKYLSDNKFDIVALQEDFGYHKNLIAGLTGYSYMTNHTGTIPGGDGLNIFTATMPIYNETRVAWNDACGILTDGSDELTPKGFVYTVIDLGNGIYVDFYNLHADAYGGAGSKAARTSQYKQIAEFIEARSKENNRPVIVTGDFNNHLHYFEEDAALYNIFCEQLGMKDAWVEFCNDGNYKDFSKWFATGVTAWGNWDAVERYMYRSGGGVDIEVSDLRYVAVTKADGTAVSDHNSAECDFTFIKTEDFVENTEELSVVKTPATNFFNQIYWFFKALMMIFSDIDNLPSILEELF